MRFLPEPTAVLASLLGRLKSDEGSKFLLHRALGDEDTIRYVVPRAARPPHISCLALESSVLCACLRGVLP